MDLQPKIPTLKDAQKPQLKIKGLGAGLTLFDRLKQFKKKDLAFILAGLGTLFMAPLAEHFMMAPESGDATLQKGWGGGSGAGGNLFGSGSSPYENGNNSIAQGGAIGGGGDIITPLNVRDPSALVMGPNGTQQPPAGSAAPAVAPPTAPARSETDYKDALAGAASRAASAAVKKAPLPIPKIAVGGSGLRGLGAASGGGSSASGSLGPINSGNLGQAGAGGGGLGLVRGAPGYKGVAGARGPNSPQGLDGTRKAGANAGDAFSRTGSALGGLNAAASEQIPTGGTGFNGGGAGGSGANDKAPAGSGAGGSKSVGESLAFIEAKERMMENLKLEFEKKKLNDGGLLFAQIRNDSLKAMAGEVTKSLTKSVLGFMNYETAGAKKTIECKPYIAAGTPLSAAAGNTCKDEDGGLDCFVNKGAKWFYFKTKQIMVDCTVTTEKGDAGPNNSEGNAINDLTAGIGSVCDKIGADIKKGGKSDYDTYLRGTVLPAAKNVELARNTLIPGGGITCGSTPVTGDTASKKLGDAKAKLYAAAATAGADGKVPAATDALGLITAGADKTDAELAKVPAQALVDATTLIGEAKVLIDKAETDLGARLPAATKLGTDASAFTDVTKEVGKIQTAHTQATDIIHALRETSVKLKDGITSIEPLVKDPAKPVGALPDQLALNKTRDGLADEAGVTPPVASKVTLPQTKGEVVKEQQANLTDLTALQTAINTAATTDAAAKAAPGDATKKAAADKAATDMKAALEKGKTSTTTSQTALKKVVTDSIEPAIRPIATKGTP